MDKQSAQQAATRLELALDLFAAGEEIKRQALKRQYPNADPEEIEKRLVEWLHQRPGAEHGDAMGWPVTLSEDHE